MKKRICTIIFSLIVILEIDVAAEESFFEQGNYNIKIGNDYSKIKKSEYIQNNRMFVPLRELCDNLNIPVAWNHQNNEAHIDIYHRDVNVSHVTKLKPEGVIPDEETALKIGKILLETYVGENMEYETDEEKVFFRAFYTEDNNSWTVVLNKRKKQGIYVAEFVRPPYIVLNKNTGEVMYINTKTHSI